MASDVSEYWERRRELTPSPERPAATDGDRRLALVVDVTDTAVVDRYERLRNRLDDFDCLLPTPPDELHVTAKLLDRRPRGSADEDGVPDMAAVGTAVREAVAEYAPFEIAFPRLNLFPDAVYAEVDDDGALSALNRALCDRPETLAGDRDTDTYLPHLTLGYFSGDEDYHRLVDFLEAQRELSFPTTTVSELALAEYAVTAEWPSAARTVETYSL